MTLVRATARPRWLVLLLLALLCLTEAVLHRSEQWLLTYGLGDGTRWNQLSYPCGFHFHHDVDDEPLHAEAFGLAQYATALARGEGSFQLSSGYPGLQYRLAVPFLGSLLLPVLRFAQAVWVTNLVVWVATCLAMYWLAERIFACRRTAIFAGLLTATSHALVILINDPKAASLQLALPACLVALSLRLDHFSGDTSPRGLSRSWLLGLAVGLATFGSAAPLFFFPFLVLYALLEMGWRALLARNAALGLGFLCAAWPILRVTAVSGGGGPGLLQHVSAGIDWALWWEVYRDKMLHHFPLLVPWHLWLGLLAAPLLLRRAQGRVIACMFASLVSAEVLMLMATSPYFRWTIGYIYLHLLFPLYLLDARLLSAAWARDRGASWRTGARRLGVVLFVGATVLSSNMILLGNHYFVHTFARRTPSQVLVHTWFSYDNLELCRRQARR